MSVTPGGSSVLGPLALALALDACASQVDPASFAPQLFVESSLDVRVIHDNAYGTSYYHLSLDDAVVRAQRFLSDGPDSARCLYARSHGNSCSIDVGIAQINQSNFAHYGVSASNIAVMFDPRMNLAIGADIMHRAWEIAVYVSEHDPAAWSREIALYGNMDPRQVMLRSAFSIYNSNSAFASPTYVARIVAAAHNPHVREIVALAYAHRRSAGACADVDVTEVADAF